MYDADGPVNFSPVVVLSRLALAAGVCTIAAGIRKSGSRKSWLIVLNGLALSAYGLIPLFWKGPLSFLLFARLLVVMAISIGIFELVTARALWHRHRVAGRRVCRPGRSGVVWFCRGVSGFGAGLAATGTQGFSPIRFSLAGPLLWLHRNLHAGIRNPAWIFVLLIFRGNPVCAVDDQHIHRDLLSAPIWAIIYLLNPDCGGSIWSGTPLG